MLFVTLVFAAIRAAVAPGEVSAAFDHVVGPFTFVCSSIIPFVYAFAMNVVILEFAFVYAYFGLDEMALAVLFIVDIIAFVEGSILPSFLAYTMVHIAFPLALVTRPILSTSMRPLPIRPITLPFTNIYISTGKDHASNPVPFAPFPKAFIPRTIWPNLNASPLNDIVDDMPFPLIHSLIIKDHQVPDFIL